MEQTCTRCKTRPRRAARQRLCRECHAQEQREWRKQVKADLALARTIIAHANLAPRRRGAIVSSEKIIEGVASVEVLRPQPGDVVVIRSEGTLSKEHVEKLRAMFGASVRLQTEQQAMAYVRGLALELKRGSEALLKAAETLKAAGKVNAANQTYLAHKAMAAKASEVLGG